VPVIQGRHLVPIGADQPVGNVAKAHRIDCSTVNQDFRYDVSGLSTVRFQGVFATGADTAVLTVYRSLDGCTPVAAGETVVPTTAPETMTDVIDVSADPFLIVRVTTADSGIFCNLFAYGKSSD
jgi:hypothetical protein